MQRVVYLVCNGATNSRHFRQFFCTRAPNTSGTAKMHQKLASTLGSDSGNFFQLALIAFFTSARTVACDRKAMRLVANMLQQVARF